MDIADIVIVGTGAAATTTLIEVFTKLLEDPFSIRKLNITVVEKYPEFWKGIPYGSRSSVNSLTITAISDFVSNGKEKDRFFQWIKENQSKWSDYYREKGGLAAKVWLKKNLPLIERSEWHKIYIPRFLFGTYMHEQMLNLIQKVEERKLVNLTVIQAEAVDVKLVDSLYEVTLEYPEKTIVNILTIKLVIAIGSAPVKNNIDLNSLNGEYVYVNDLYQYTLDENLKTLKKILTNTQKLEERNVLIIGSNASCIELMYLLYHRSDILCFTNKIVAISHTGKLPCHISEVALERYPCENLDKIKTAGKYDIHSLIEATKKDLQPAVQCEVIVPYVDHVITYAIELMHTMDESSKKIFFGIYGPQLSRLIRRSGPDYKSSSDTLIKENRLQILKGSFLTIESTPRGGLLNYFDMDNQALTYKSSFKVVINCSGSDDLQCSSSRLIYNLVQRDICKVNLSKKGFLVNESFESAPNLFIMGPLLGGNMNKLIHFWHLENVARLQYLSLHLATILLSKVDYLAGKEEMKSTYKVNN